jgi:hypothetical protein
MSSLLACFAAIKPKGNQEKTVKPIAQFYAIISKPLNQRGLLSLKYTCTPFTTFV